jgi:RNA recognition motif-containing protein
VKNFPAEMTDAELKEVFSEFGEISSLKPIKNENGATAFICFGKQGEDRNYG